MIRPLFDMGLASTTPIQVNNTIIPPRDFFKKLLQENIPSRGQDAVLLQVRGMGKIKNQQQTHTYQIIDYYDTKNNISAMQRMTGYPVAITAELILDDHITKHGVYCPEEIITPDTMFKELNNRGIILKSII